MGVSPTSAPSLPREPKQRSRPTGDDEAIGLANLSGWCRYRGRQRILQRDGDNVTTVWME
ncbi:MAG: hypothetical protein ACREX3_14670 [Gammaproteobacteria bacterium]